MSEQDEIYMKEAIRLARKGLGKTSPNPAVGAVIVRRGKIIASGYHRKAGMNHAEVEALSNLKGRALIGDSLYVNLEPCNHQGRTPPCTEAILKRGIKRVVFGMHDPNPDVSGGGHKFLEENGVEVLSGVLESECKKVNESYITYVTKDRPFVIAKSALTLDGWSATSTGHSKWVTNDRSRNYVQRLRERVDGIMVGVGTILADDPLLTARPGGRRGKDPVRIVLDTHLRVPPEARIFKQDSDSPTLIAIGDSTRPGLLKDFENRNTTTIICPTKGKRIDLEAFMNILGKMSITSVLLEGGATLMGAMIRERLIDKFYIFKAPRILGGNDGIAMAKGKGPVRMDESLVLRDIRIRRFGDDMLIRGYPEYETKARGARRKA